MTAPPFHVTEHAALRWIERVRPGLVYSQAVAEISFHGRAIETAIAFGARSVKLGCGARLVIKGGAVVTVLSRDQRRVVNDASVAVGIRATAERRVR